MGSNREQLVLGLNSSTQSFSGTVINPAQGSIIWAGRVNFAEELGSKYGIGSGFIERGNGVVVAPPLMWLEALDLLLQRLRESIGETEVTNITRITGAGQQHGTVYLSGEAGEILRNPDANRPLHAQLGANCFTRSESPIWMDSSTGSQCRIFEERLGGRLNVAVRTGSVAMERFSGPQILKFAMESPDDYTRTAHIALISSFICGMFLGELAPTEPGDGAGMNLMNIETFEWDKTIIEALSDYAPQLSAKLPKISPACSEIGPVSEFMCARYGFSPRACVLPFSGDNPDSLLGMGVTGRDASGQIVLSLGTSDTIFGATDRAFDPSGSGSIFGFADGGRMLLLCFRNGSLAREKVKSHYLGTDANWKDFVSVLKRTPRANGGRFMLPFFAPEITPNTENRSLVQRYGGLDDSDGPANIRAVVESQFLNIGYHLAALQMRPKTIRVTGGAAVNREILQIAADVLDAELMLLSAPSNAGGIVTDSVSLGAALRGASSLGFSLETLSERFCSTNSERIVPQNASDYEVLRSAYAAALSDRFVRYD